MFTFRVVVVHLPIDCILSFLFLAETDVLVPVLSRSTDVVVVNFVVVLKFPNEMAHLRKWPTGWGHPVNFARKFNSASLLTTGLLRG